MTILCIEETFYAYMALPSLHGRKASNILESYSFRTKDKYFEKTKFPASTTNIYYDLCKTIMYIMSFNTSVINTDMEKNYHIFPFHLISTDVNI